MQVRKFLPKHIVFWNGGYNVLSRLQLKIKRYEAK
jgi:hypothetical protein